MNVTIEIPDEQAAALRAQAEAQGLTVERWLGKLAAELLPPAPAADLQQSNPTEWTRHFRACAESHDRNTPVLSDDAMSRASVYTDRAWNRVLAGRRGQVHYRPKMILSR